MALNSQCNKIQSNSSEASTMGMGQKKVEKGGSRVWERGQQEGSRGRASNN